MRHESCCLGFVTNSLARPAPAILLFLLILASFGALASAEGHHLALGYQAPDSTLPAELLSPSSSAGQKAVSAQADFSADMPPVIDQGAALTDVAWACGYYAYGFMKAEELGWEDYTPETTFSAMMLYWLCTRLQPNAPSVACSIGFDPDVANEKFSMLSWLNRIGICTVAQWGDLWPQWYWRLATTADLVNAYNYKNEASPNRRPLFSNAASATPPFTNDIAAVKEQIANRTPVIIGLNWSNVSNPGAPAAPNYLYDWGSSAVAGGHALCLVGYDDAHAGVGAFKAIDSLGTGHGDAGYVWLSYELMNKGVQEAWIILDSPAEDPKITEAEYFIGPFQHSLAGLDAGLGENQPLVAKDGVFDERIEEVAFTLDASDTSLFPRPGMYSGAVRFRSSSDGVWSIARRFDVRVDPLEDSTLVAAEAFIDVDPGAGGGISLALGEALPIVQLTDFLASTGIAPGLHTVNVRVQDNYGYWSLPRQVTFEMQASGTTTIVAAEWTTDVATEPGAGIKMEAVDGNLDSTEELIRALDVTPEWSPTDNRVIVRVQDSIGRWGEASLIDTTPPVAVCRDITVPLDGANSITITGADVDGGSTDDLLITAIDVTPAVFTCAELGENVVLVTVTDISGNTDTCEATVTVEDTRAPLISSCPGNQTVNANENCQAAVPDLTVGVVASDNCTASPELLITQSPTAGTNVGLGQHEIGITVSDAVGNLATCSATLTVTDGTAPEITVCATDQELHAGAACQATVPDMTVGVVASDNCTGAAELVISQSPLSGAQVGLGEHTVTITVADTVGNEASCSAALRVVDAQAPVITACPSGRELTADASCQAVVPDFTAGLDVSDNCGSGPSLIVEQSPTAGTSVGLGEHVITVTVSDASDNEATCLATLSVVEAGMPIITACPSDRRLAAGADCQVLVPDVTGEVEASDSCADITQLVITQSPVAGTPVGPGEHVITVTVTDAPGNPASCTAALTVEDETAPEITTCPSDQELPMNAACQAVIPDLTVGVIASDNCTAAAELVIAQSPLPGAYVGPGEYPITITVADAAGNETPCTVTLSVKDTDAPVIMTCAIDQILDADENCQAAVPDVTKQIMASDSCTADGDLIISQSHEAGTLVDSGEHTLTITVADASGNEATCTVTLTVSETTVPEITTCPSDRQLYVGAGCHAFVPDFTAGIIASDNCTAPADLVIVQLPGVGTQVGPGEHVITVIVADVLGNEASCTAKLQVSDGDMPEITLRGAAMVTVSCGDTYTDEGATAVDTCDGILTENIQVGGDVVNTKVPDEYVITYSVRDAAGNMAPMKTRTVVVLDNCPPFMGHPGDLNEDWRMVIGEAIAYITGWQQGNNSIAYAIRGVFLWQNGEYYTYDPALTPPLCWVLTVKGGDISETAGK